MSDQAGERKPIDHRDKREARERLEDAVWNAVEMGWESWEIDNIAGQAAHEAKESLEGNQ